MATQLAAMAHDAVDQRCWAGNQYRLGQELRTLIDGVCQGRNSKLINHRQHHGVDQSNQYVTNRGGDLVLVLPEGASESDEDVQTTRATEANAASTTVEGVSIS